MNVITFGSRIVDDAIVNGKHKNRMRIRGLSPFSISSQSLDKFRIKSEELLVDNDYKRNMLSMDISKNIPMVDSYDYIIVDFAEAYQKIREFKLEDGSFLRITNNYTDNCFSQIEKKLFELTGFKVTKVDVIDPMLWSDAVIRREASKFSEWMCLNFPVEKIVLLRNKIPYHKKGEMGVVEVENYNTICRYENFCRICEDVFKEHVSCKEIPAVNVVLGSKDCSLENLTYEKSYYAYITDVLTMFKSKKSEIDSLSIKYRDVLQDEIDMCLIDDVVNRAKKKLMGRKLLLIGGSKELRKHIEKTYDLRVDKHLEYSRYSSKDELFETINSYKRKYNEYLCIIPHLFHDELLECLYKNYLFIERDVFIPQHDLMVFRDFKGIYSDIYNNVIICEKALNMYVVGLGARAEIKDSNKALFLIDINLANQSDVYVGENVMGHWLRISTLDGSKTTIEREATFADNCCIAMTGYSRVEIGEDAMFSSKVIVHAGDGHSIFEQHSGLKTSSTPEIIGTPKNEIIIGKHVWVGYQVFLLPGTNIGNGSIVGARSMVNKKFPNNCIIAGNKARIVKQDIGWARDPFSTDIYSENIDPECIQFTKID